MDDQNIDDNDRSMRVEEQHKVIVDFLMNNNDMKKAGKNSLKQGLYAGTGAVMGGILLGPIGGLIGGIGGSIIGFTQSDNYNGVVQQIISLENVHQQKIVDAVKITLLDAGASAPRAFTSIDNFKATLNEYSTNRIVRDQIWNACLNAIHET